MGKSPFITIIIVTHGAVEMVRNCLASVRQENDGSLEVIVVDNASTDGCADMIATEFPFVQLLRNTENIGFSPANNQGLAMAKAPWLMLLNPDTVLHGGSVELWLREHVRTGAAISGPRLLNPDGSFQVSAWKVPGAIASVTELFNLHRAFGVGAYPKDRYRTDFEPGFVSGAAMLFSREVVEKIGMLDPEMFWMEDVDLCLRARNAGGRVMFLPAPQITHIGGQSSKKDLGRVISNQLISRIKFMSKHGGMGGRVVLTSAVWLQIVTRSFAFAVLSVVRKEPKAQAYRVAWAKFNRYIFQHDRSI